MSRGWIAMHTGGKHQVLGGGFPDRWEGWGPPVQIYNRGRIVQHSITVSNNIVKCFLYATSTNKCFTNKQPTQSSFTNKTTIFIKTKSTYTTQNQ
jgi:hypothetical protein